MENVYDWCETIVLWGSVLISVGLIGYLARRQYRTMRRRRIHHRHRERRMSRRAGAERAASISD